MAPRTEGERPSFVPVEPCAVALEKGEQRVASVGSVRSAASQRILTAIQPAQAAESMGRSSGAEALVQLCRTETLQRRMLEDGARVAHARRCQRKRVAAHRRAGGDLKSGAAAVRPTQCIRLAARVDEQHGLPLRQLGESAEGSRIAATDEGEHAVPIIRWASPTGAVASGTATRSSSNSRPKSAAARCASAAPSSAPSAAEASGPAWTSHGPSSATSWRRRRQNARRTSSAGEPQCWNDGVVAGSCGTSIPAGARGGRRIAERRGISKIAPSRCAIALSPVE